MVEEGFLQEKNFKSLLIGTDEGQVLRMITA
jgi:hypothetical protein